jgi:hypothetical protein
MHRFAIALLAACVAASAAAAAPPKTALLTHVKAEPGRVVFSFRTAPRQVTAAYVPKSQVVESGSGRRVTVAGAKALVLRFTPASGADLSGNSLRITYKGPRRLKPATAGSVREVVRVSDFEAELGWAIGLDRKHAYRVTRDGPNIVIAFS